MTEKKRFPWAMLACCALAGAAFAGDATTAVGSGVGAAAGAAIGEQQGGKQGAVIGGAVGGASGAAIGHDAGGAKGAVAGAAIGGAAGGVIGKNVTQTEAANRTAGGAAITGVAVAGSRRGDRDGERRYRDRDDRKGKKHKGKNRKHCDDEHPGRGHAYGKYKDCD